LSRAALGVCGPCGEIASVCAVASVNAAIWRNRWLIPEAWHDLEAGLSRTQRKTDRSFKPSHLRSSAEQRERHIDETHRPLFHLDHFVRAPGVGGDGNDGTAATLERGGAGIASQPSRRKEGHATAGWIVVLARRNLPYACASARRRGPNRTCGRGRRQGLVVYPRRERRIISRRDQGGRDRACPARRCAGISAAH